MLEPWKYKVADLNAITISEVRRNRSFVPSLTPKDSDTKTLLLMDRSFNSLELLNGRTFKCDLSAKFATFGDQNIVVLHGATWPSMPQHR